VVTEIGIVHSVTVMSDPATLRSRRPPWWLIMGLLVFAYALLSKWNKWPGGTMLLIVSTVVTLLGVVVHRMRGKEGSTTNWTRAAVAMMVLYVVARLLYWPIGLVIGIAALALAAQAGRLWWRDRPSKALPWTLSFVLAVTIGLMLVPTHALYRYMFFETPGAKRFMHTGTGHWYRYSWLLYQDGQFEKSAAMLDSAMAEVDAHKARTGKDGSWLLNELQQTRKLVVAREWNAFQELHRPEQIAKP
jgi:hypothetical protein